MTDYKLEFYKKNARQPYRVQNVTLKDGERPRSIYSDQAFHGLIANSSASKVKIRYAKNGALVGETYMSNGVRRIRWFRS